MARSHPPTLITLARRCLVEECAITRGERILVAVSGGPDSTALLHVLACLTRDLGIELHAHGVDHGLRVEAAAELDRAEAVAKACGVPFTRSRLDVRKGGNLQARARDARYRALRHAAASARCAVIATGHHADDRAETVVQRMLRGAGPRGLSVLPPRSEDLIRPLLRARRVDVLRHIARHELPSSEDPSNADDRFLRSRVRKELMPLLESLSPGVVGHLNALADQLASPPPAPVLDANGETVPLKRAHLDQIRHALERGGREVRWVRLPGGRAVRVDPTTGDLQLVSPAVRA